MSPRHITRPQQWGMPHGTVGPTKANEPARRRRAPVREPRHASDARGQRQVRRPDRPGCRHDAGTTAVSSGGCDGPATGRIHDDRPARAPAGAVVGANPVACGHTLPLSPLGLVPGSSGPLPNRHELQTPEWRCDWRRSAPFTPASIPVIHDHRGRQPGVPRGTSRTHEVGPWAHRRIAGSPVAAPEPRRQILPGSSRGRRELRVDKSLT